MDEAKIVIAGTGRAGTTLLVQVLTELGCDTGFRPGVRPDEHARAGLERNVLAANAPRIVKSPRLSTKLRPMLEAGEVRLEHVIVPVRDLDVAAASRVRAASYGREAKNWGGLFGTNRATKQREALALVLYELVYTLARFDVPHTLLLFPRFAEDAAYLHAKLG
ncbi:MAG TPA: hypothetical protein VFZ83_12410, partial [Acidimicrobiia bacterium]|nr:hypothetical protein [Acidimicrobiia bacterium]